MRFERDPETLGIFLEGNINSEVVIEAPESAANLRAYCSSHDGFTFVTTEGMGESQADPDLYVRIATSVTVKKNSTQSVKFTTNGKVSAVTHSGGAGKVSVTRAGNIIRFRGLAAGNPRVKLTFKMKDAGAIVKTVTVKVKKSAASLYEGEEQTISADKSSMNFAGLEAKPLEIKVAGAETALAYHLSKTGIVDISIGENGIVTVAPKKSGSTVLELQAVADDVYNASNTVSIKITVKASENTGTDTEKNVKKAKAAKVTKLSVKAKAKKKARVTWKAVKGVSGYQIKYSMDKKFKKNVRKVTVKGAKKKAVTVKKLKAGKKYFFKIRPYTNVKDVNGKTVKTYGKWSRTVKIKAKK